MAAVTLRRGWVGIALESTAGVPVNPSNYIPFLESSLIEKHVPVQDQAAYGVRDAFGELSAVGKKWGEGNLKVNLDPTLSGYLLGLAMGNFGSPTNEGGGVYTHLFTVASANVPKTASIIFDRVVDRNLFTYAVVNSLEVSFADGLATASAGFLSRFPVTSVSGSLTTSSGILFSRVDANLKVGSSIANAEAASALNVVNASVKINNSAEAVHVAGDVTPNQVVVKDFSVDAEVKILFENTTQRDYFRNLTKNAVVLTFNGRGIGGGFTEFIKFRFYKTSVQEYSLESGLGNVMIETLKMQGEYDSSNSKTLDVQVRNRTASY